MIGGWELTDDPNAAIRHSVHGQLFGESPNRYLPGNSRPNIVTDVRIRLPYT